jgi:Tfp pilus assembly protein PilO
LRLGFRAAAATALAAAACLYYVALLQPIEGRRNQILGDADKSQQVVESARRSRKMHTDLRSALAELQRRGAATRQRIPEHAGENEFLQFLSHSAKESGLEIGDYQPQGIAQKETHSELRIRVKCHGKFVALCGLLGQLQQQQRLIAIESLSVDSDLGSDEHAADMTLVLFFGLKAEIGAEAKSKPGAQAHRTIRQRGRDA